MGSGNNWMHGVNEGTTAQTARHLSGRADGFYSSVTREWKVSLVASKPGKGVVKIK